MSDDSVNPYATPTASLTASTPSVDGGVAVATWRSAVELELKASQVYWRALLRTPVRILARVIGGLIFLVCVASLATSKPQGSTIVLLLVSGYGLFLLPWSIRRSVRAGYFNGPGADRTVTMTFSDSGFSLVVDGVSSVQATWALMRVCILTPEGFLLCSIRESLVWVPSFAFESPHQREVAERLLINHVKTMRG